MATPGLDPACGEVAAKVRARITRCDVPHREGGALVGRWGGRGLARARLWRRPTCRGQDPEPVRGAHPGHSQRQGPQAHRVWAAGPASTKPRTANDDTFTAEDLALGYKQLMRVERCWRPRRQRGPDAGRWYPLRRPRLSPALSAPQTGAHGKHRDLGEAGVGVEGQRADVGRVQ
jgi:hypothetical protein